MKAGIMAGITWALETVILGIVLNMSPLIDTAQAVFLAPFVSTFLHDLCSAVWAWLYNLIRGNGRNIICTLRTESGKMIILAAMIGGPVGMSGYVLTINQLGSSIGAVASAIYPAVGSILAGIFLKEKIQWYRWVFLILTILGVYGLSFSPDIAVDNFGLGIAGVIMCAFGWGAEAVILARCMKDTEVKDEYILPLRQTTSALTYALIILPLVNGWGFTLSLVSASSLQLFLLIGLAAFFATVSYLFYYKAIASIGASRAMALNITYAAWAVIFSAVILHDATQINFLTVICTCTVLVCGILAAADYKDFLNR